MRNTPLLLSLLLFAACEKHSPPPEPLRPVKTIRIGLQQSEAGLSLPGEVHARHEAPLAFRVGGKIIECSVNSGDTVHNGQVLARLEPTDYQLAAQGGAANEAQARSAQILADADLKRYRELREKGFVSTAALDQKQAAADAAHAMLDAMQSNHGEQNRKLGYTSLSADGDGIITSLNCNPGQVVNAGQPVLELARSGAREIAVSVPEDSLAVFRSTRNFNIELNALPDKIWQGTLRELAGGADPATRTYAARITVKNADATMQLGMSARVRLLATGDQAAGNQALRLPLSAIVSSDSKPKAWKVDSSGIVHAAAVSIAGFDGNDVRIASGLNNGDIVVTAGANLLREGEKVKLLP